MLARRLAIAAALIVTSGCGGESQTETAAKRTTTQAPQKTTTAETATDLITVGRIQFKLSSARVRKTFEDLVPISRKDRMLVVNGRVFRGKLNKLGKWSVSVEDERGRTESAAFTRTVGVEGKPGRFTWVFVVAKRWRSLTLQLPKKKSINLAPLLSR